MILRIALCFLALAIGLADDASAQPARTYAVLSLAGNQLAIHAVRPDVGTRVSGATVNVLPIAEQVLDQAILLSADAALKDAAPATRPVLMMSQDVALYKAGDSLFDQSPVNAENRSYLQGLARERNATHLILITRTRDNTPVKLARNTTVTNGMLEGLGYFIDDTTRLFDVQTAESYFGMVAPFAYLKVRLVDVQTMQVLRAEPAVYSFPLARASSYPNAMAMWSDRTTDQKMKDMRDAVDGALAPALKALINTK